MVSDTSFNPSSISKHMVFESQDSKKKTPKNIQLTFGAGLKYDSDRILKVVSQSGCTGCSIWLSNCLLRHS